MNSFYKFFITLCFFLSSFFISYSQSKEKLDDCPTSLEITPLETCGDYQFTLGEGQPNEDVYWFFDDGTYVDHVSYTVMHHYANHGSYSGYVQYTSDLCSTTTYNFLVMVPGCSTDGMEEVERTKLVVFPNPSSDFLYLSNDDEEEIQSIQIVNHKGKIVCELTNTKDKIIKLNVQKIPSGIYQLVIQKSPDIQVNTISVVR